MQTHGNEDSVFFLMMQTPNNNKKTFVGVDDILACFLKKWHD